MESRSEVGSTALVAVPSVRALLWLMEFGFPSIFGGAYADVNKASWSEGAIPSKFC